MGLLHEIAGPLSQQFSQQGTAAQIAIAVGGFLFVTIFINVLSQVLFRNPNEPPLVFHWFPIIGSTITYGMDPPRFFAENRKKVSRQTFLSRRAHTHSGQLTAFCYFLPYSMATALPLCCSARRPLSTLGPTATTLS